ncbi:ATP-dependent DNA helicase [Magnetospirillum gryphiswaldense]|uniref:ATP-dependent DNA helicase n=1 Tax=Magnetospirillum gryphiswaldense TaxID=55518 RepID=UPI000D031AEF|nr:ATP-dependent DNA helicase [Magnetospirillum gryphiswaldense]AVM73075.1 putative ATP-dependent helicase DinG [Magnetospirillum gryphiswaldense MSR-1]AVM76978.1 putative ATP-dependent helicase DinG [Magnetospirillum gryphiswaldense]
MSAPPAPPRLLLPHAPALTVSLRGAVLLDTDGEFHHLPLAAAGRRARDECPMLCHATAVAARLGLEPFACLDLLELFAFVRPARFCLPTIKGLAEALGLARPADAEDEAEMLIRAARTLLQEVGERTAADTAARASDTRSAAWAMARAGWGWGTSVLAALGVTGDAGRGSGLRVWERLPEWSEHAPEPPSGSIAVDPIEARHRLDRLLGSDSEQRPAQADYASAAAAAFQPREQAGEPRLVLAEAGTGTGKTLGYIAPASVWAEKNGAPVWISTYTRNLQRQLDNELDRLYPDPGTKARKVVVRKGRENYLCLLNLEEQVMRNRPQEAVASGLMARWALATRDGDMVGGDFPAWLGDILGRARTLGLADRRGECIFSACPHYSRCYIERAVRKARRADIVIANHALVMIQAAMGGLDDGATPTRYVFDEGHHVFDAADGAFSAHLSGLEGIEVRRWLLGAEEGSGKSRARGLKRRAEDLLGLAAEAPNALDAALAAAHALPATGWQNRLQDGAPVNAAERFLALVRQQVYARTQGADSPYSLETECRPPIDGLLEAAAELAHALGKLGAPLQILARVLGQCLDDDAAELDTNIRSRIEGLTRSIERRALLPIAGWKAMLEELIEGRSPTADGVDRYVDWFSVERIDGRDFDVGMHRHWIDPTLPFAKTVAEPAHGLLITSATLRDGESDMGWLAAERRSGAIHLPSPPVRAAMASPFDYPNQTRVLVVSDVRKDDLNQVAAAYRELFLAAGGGGLGLFTAISRLKAVHKRIAEPLDEAGLPLYAQHIDALDTATLVDIFRAEEESCLLGTDAVRDGVDVPGRSLRLIVFDRVPWPRPDILHKHRRNAFGGKAYDDMIARLRLKQAFGRLVRRAGDHGVFVLLDPMMPSRLHGAFPPGVTIRKVGLAEAVAETRVFLGLGLQPE